MLSKIEEKERDLSVHSVYQAIRRHCPAVGYSPETGGWCETARGVQARSAHGPSGAESGAGGRGREPWRPGLERLTLLGDVEALGPVRVRVRAPEDLSKRSVVRLLDTARSRHVTEVSSPVDCGANRGRLTLSVSADAQMGTSQFGHLGRMRMIVHTMCHPDMNKASTCKNLVDEQSRDQLGESDRDGRPSTDLSAESSSRPAANSVSGWAIKSVTRSSMLLGSSTNVGRAIYRWDTQWKEGQAAGTS